MAVSRPICAVLLTPASRTLVGSRKLHAIRSRLRSSSFSFSFPRHGPPAPACRRCLHGYGLTFQLPAVHCHRPGSCVATLAPVETSVHRGNFKRLRSNTQINSQKQIKYFPDSQVKSKNSQSLYAGKKRHCSMESLGVSL
jgi:hypothetical protein